MNPYERQNNTVTTRLETCRYNSMKAKIASGVVLVGVIIGLLIYTQPERLVPPPTALEQQTTSSQTHPRPGRDLLASAPVVVEPVQETPTITNLLNRLLHDGEAPRLTLEQAEAYLNQNGRNVESLLAASDASDRKYLREAMEKFPNDPRVAFRAAYFAAYSANPNATEEEANSSRRQWLDVFKQSAPDNAMADYLSAADHFRAGDKDKAFAEMASGMRKSMEDYSQDFMLNAEEAYRQAGYSEAESKLIANMSLLLPQEAQFKSAGRSLVELATAFRQAGDQGSADAALQMAINFGQRLNSPNSLTLIEPLVGIAIQNIAYKSLDPNGMFGDSGKTVQWQLDSLTQQRAGIKAIAQNWDNITSRMSETDLVAYLNRQRLYGEQATMQWARTRFGVQ